MFNILIKPNYKAKSLVRKFTELHLFVFQYISVDFVVIKYKNSWYIRFTF